MSLRGMSRNALGGSLQLMRMPIDGLLGLAGDSQRVTSVKLALDRADASVRALAGTVLGDPVLREDAEFRREAVEDRERAANLKEEANLRSQRADKQASEGKRQAQRRRQQASESAKRTRQKAQQRRKTTKAKAGQRAGQRRQAAKASAARTERVIEERAKGARLEQLDARRDALGEKESALSATDEARRLGKAAATVKQDRKGDK